MNARQTLHQLANKFHAGQAMTAEDVTNARAAAQVFANPESISLYSQIKQQVEDAAKSND